MASSIPPALDYLVAQVRALPAMADVKVSDGWPGERGDSMVVIGINPDDDESGVVANYAELSGLETEEVDVPCMVWARRVGDQAASRARVDAFALLDAIRDLIRSDRRLGGNVRPGLPARVSGWTMAQTSAASPAGEGRGCEIRFVVSWQHRG